jgi:toxin ParE1/3/4
VPVRVKWLRTALANLNAAGAYIARDNPQAAAVTVRRIVDAIYALAENPQLDISRAGRVPGTRELIVNRTYLVAYRVRHGELEVLRILHGRQRWPEQLP